MIRLHLHSEAGALIGTDSPPDWDEELDEAPAADCSIYSEMAKVVKLGLL